MEAHDGENSSSSKPVERRYMEGQWAGGLQLLSRCTGNVRMLNRVRTELPLCAHSLYIDGPWCGSSGLLKDFRKFHRKELAQVAEARYSQEVATIGATRTANRDLLQVRL